MRDVHAHRTLKRAGVNLPVTMGLLNVLMEMLEGYMEGGTEEALSEGVEEVAEEATGRDF